MAFVEFEKANGDKILSNIDRITGVTMVDGIVRLIYSPGDFVHIRGTWDEVIERLGAATDVYVEEREEVEA